MTNEEFAIHVQRMEDHGCNLGVAVSTSGYKIGRGLGIAETVHRNSWKDMFHLLLVFESLKMTAVDGVAPLDILTDALGYAMGDQFENDSKLQDRYSAKRCHELIASEYERIHGAT